MKSSDTTRPIMGSTNGETNLETSREISSLSRGLSSPRGFASLRHPYLQGIVQQLSESDQERSVLLDLYALQSVLDYHSHSQIRLTHPCLSLLLGALRASKQGLSYLDLTIEEQSVVLDLIEAGLVLKVERVSQVERVSNANISDSPECPFVLDGTRLYVQRVWRLQQSIDQWMVSRREQSEAFLSQVISDSAPSSLLSQVFAGLFPNSAFITATRATKTVHRPSTDWQAVAAIQALSQSVLILTGGPGTGKTTTATKILLCLLVQQALFEEQVGLAQRSDDDITPRFPKIRLLAPTGKAAVKLHQSISQRLPSLLEDLEQSLGEPFQALKLSQTLSLPKEGETLHRALGIRADGSHGFGASLPALDLRRYDPAQHYGKLDADILLIDEASMIDLALMNTLLAQIPDHCRVIFMGDQDQLPPVEAGEVLYEWVQNEGSQHYSEAQRELIQTWLPGQSMAAFGKEDEPGAQQRHLCQLQHTYRFSGPIYDLAQLLKGQATSGIEEFEALVPIGSSPWRTSEQADLFTPAALSWLDLNALSSESDGDALSHYATQMLNGYQAYFDLLARSRTTEGALTDSMILSLFEAKSTFQILGAMYEGRLGIVELNQWVEAQFSATIAQNRLVANGRSQDAFQGSLYHGKVIMVTRNQPALNIFNGDLGIVLNRRLNDQDVATVVFQDKPSANGAALLELPLHLVEHWQTAYAMTVHKSQGSEYEKVAIVLPEAAKALLSKRLLYTAITRSQQEVELWATRDLLGTCLE